MQLEEFIEYNQHTRNEAFNPKEEPKKKKLIKEMSGHAKLVDLDTTTTLH